MKSKELDISKVEIVFFRPRNGHLGFASLVANDQFYISDIAIFSRPTGGIRLGFPVKRLANGEAVDVLKPLNSKVEKIVEAAVLERYETLMNNNESEGEIVHGKKEISIQ